MDLYLKVRRAHFQDGLSGRRIARDFGISRDSVSKMLAYSEPPGYRRTAPVKRPRLDGFTDQIDQWLLEDKVRPRKQRHTAKRVFERLRDECGFSGGYTIVKDYVRSKKCQSRRKKGPFAGVKVGQLRCRALLGVLPIKLTRDKAHVGQRPTSIKFRPGSGSGVSALF